MEVRADVAADSNIHLLCEDGLVGFKQQLEETLSSAKFDDLGG